jgi:adenylate kinase family enzyme
MEDWYIPSVDSSISIENSCCLRRDPSDNSYHTINTLPKGKLIFIHGISGSGKSTIGKELYTRLHNSVWIDQDQFYRKEKPLITFTNDDNSIYYTTSNWDSEEAIDFESLRAKINELRYKFSYVIVTGFALRLHLLRLKADYSFLLVFNVSDKKAIEIVTKTRMESKQFNTSEKVEKDYWMVRKVVWPFYLDTLEKIEPSMRVFTFIDGQRLSSSVIAGKITRYINSNQK